MSIVIGMTSGHMDRRKAFGSPNQQARLLPRRNPEFLGPRLGDKVIMSILVSTLYLGIGDDFSLGNVINIGAVLFMWCTLPACAPAASAFPFLQCDFVSVKVHHVVNVGAAPFGTVITRHVPLWRMHEVHKRWSSKHATASAS